MLEYNLPVQNIEGMPGVEVTLEGRYVSIIYWAVMRQHEFSD